MIYVQEKKEGGGGGTGRAGGKINDRPCCTPGVTEQGSWADTFYKKKRNQILQEKWLFKIIPRSKSTKYFAFIVV